MPSKKNAKATKKFEKKHLKGVLERRKANAKVKQRAILKDKKKAKRAKDVQDEAANGRATGANATAVTKKAPKVSDMSVDDFFQGGFEFLKDSDMDKKASQQPRPGKRKRGEEATAKEADDESDSDASFDEQPAFSDSEAGSEQDDANLDRGMSKKAMDDLAQKDPEFYKFLKENDPEALDFDENADLAEVDELSAGEDGSVDEQPKKKRKKRAAEEVADNELTRETIARWKKALDETQSLRAMRQVVLAFRAAAHLNLEEEEKEQKFKISDPQVFQEILVLALTQVPAAINHHVPVKTSASGKVHLNTEGTKYKTLSVLIKTFVASIINLLGSLSDDGTLKLTMSAIVPIIPHLLGFRKLLKALMKTVVNFWAQPSSSDSTRITAFLVLRKLVEVGDRGVRETVLKVTYQGLVQGCRKTDANTIQSINLMKNSAAELWGIDQSIGYVVAFQYIRQLAILLRNSIVHSKKEAYRQVYNWQYTHSLDFWSCVLAEHCSSVKQAEAGKESTLKLLIYPLVQVTLGAMGLVPSPMYFPLRFHLIRSLLRITRATGTYIPLASSLLEVLNSADMKRPPKGADLKALDFRLSYKASKAYLRTRIYQDGVGEQVVELFGEYFALWSTSIAFPEFALPVVLQLRKWLKEVRNKATGSRNAKLASSVTVLVQKIESNSRFIEERRAKVDFAPKDRAQVDAFLRDFDADKTPIGAYVVVQRQLNAERAKERDESRKEDERKRREEKEEALERMEVDESDEEADEDEDEEDADMDDFAGFEGEEDDE